MSRLNAIQQKIIELDPASYQKMMDSYFCNKYGFQNIMSLGSKEGQNKTTKGTPDSFVKCDNGKYILIEYGTVQSSVVAKIRSDIKDCLDENKTGISVDQIEQIICCHTSTNLKPGDVESLCSMFSNVLLVGLDDVSMDLCYRFQNIAKDFLGIAGDTNQICSIGEYIHSFSKNQYATPLDTQLLQRDREIKEIIDALNSTNCVLLSGKSGVGKTRLALSILEQWSSLNNSIAKVVHSNGSNICDDLSISFPDNRDYIVLIDDANEFTQLKGIVEFCNLQSRNHKFKIILTVRDYAVQTVINSIKSHCAYSIHEIFPLSDNGIKLVLSDVLDIKNDLIQQRIVDIARGNLRMAVMAAVCVSRNEFDKIRNAFELYENYYSPIVDSLSKDEIVVASIIAFFESFRMDATSLPSIISCEHGVSFISFKSIIMQLHDKEIVNLYSNGDAVKFDNQNLRDFLIYNMLLRKRIISPSYVINRAFPQYKEQIVFAFNTLMSLFSSRENAGYIRNEVNNAWNTYKSSGKNQLEFLIVFHQLLPNETLLYAKHAINDSVEEHLNLKEYDFDKHKNYHNIESDIVRLLISFKETDYFIDAAQLAICLFKKAIGNPMDLYFLFAEVWGITRASHEQDYKKENQLMDLLMDSYQNDNNDVVTFALLFFSANCLEFDHSSHEAEDGKNITFYRYGLKECAGLYELREKAIRSLIWLLGNNTTHIKAYTTIMSYPIPNTDSEIVNIFKNDMAAFCNNVFIDTTPLDYDISCIIERIHKVCKRLSIAIPPKIAEPNVKDSFPIYLALKRDYYSEDTSYEDAIQKHNATIKRIATEIRMGIFEELCFELNMRQAYDTEWSINESISLLVNLVANEGADIFIDACDMYINHNTPYCGRCDLIIDALIQAIGYDNAIKYVSEKSFDRKNLWLRTLYEKVPDNEITEYFCDVVKALAVSDLNIRPITMSLAKRINDYFPRFIVDYVAVLCKHGSSGAHMLSDFMLLLGHDDVITIDDFISLFDERTDELLSAYILAIQGRQYFDNDGALLLRLSKAVPGTVTRVIKGVSDRAYLDLDCLAMLWDSEDYLNLISEALEALYNKENAHLGLFCHTVEILFKGKERLSDKTKWDSWLENYISINNTDIEKMRFLFNNLCSLTDDYIYEGVTIFCRYNKSYEHFSQLSLTPNHASWSGSEVPLIEQRIAFLSRIKDKLVGIDFIEHRSRIDEIIHAYINKRERVLLEEFMEC